MQNFSTIRLIVRGASQKNLRGGDTTPPRRSRVNNLIDERELLPLSKTMTNDIIIAFYTNEFVVLQNSAGGKTSNFT